MPPSIRLRARAIHLLSIAFSMLLLAHVANSRLDAWLSQRPPVRYVPAVARPAIPPTPIRIEPLRDVPADEERAPREARPRGVQSDCPRLSPYVARQRGPLLFEVSRRPGTQAVEVDPACHFSDARLVPVFRHERLQGLKLFSIRPESFVAQLGLHNGDTLRKVNGRALDSPEHALEIYLQLENASLREVLLERDGKLLRYTYFTPK